jgi:osmotically-inducible protein OsmY
MKTDSQIQKDVKAKLRWEAAVDQTEIGVEVKDRIVTLSGQVASFDAKHAAENAALNVLDVKALTVELEVAPEGRVENKDRQIARAIERAVSSSPCLPGATVKIMVEEGFVTLSGEVESAHASSTIVETASNVVGVKGVRGRMTVKAAPSPAIARAETAAELERRCGIDKDDIAVQTF